MDIEKQIESMLKIHCDNWENNDAEHEAELLDENDLKNKREIILLLAYSDLLNCYYFDREHYLVSKDSNEIRRKILLIWKLLMEIMRFYKKFDYVKTSKSIVSNLEDTPIFSFSVETQIEIIQKAMIIKEQDNKKLFESFMKVINIHNLGMNDIYILFMADAMIDGEILNRDKGLFNF